MSDDGIDFQANGDDGIDFQPEEKSIGGFAENLLSNAGRMANPVEIAKGAASTIKQGLYDIPKAAAQSSVDLVKGAAKAVSGDGLPSIEDVRESPLIKKTAEMTEPIAKDPAGFAYKNPLDAAGLVAAGTGIVSPFMGAPATEMAATAAEETPKAPSTIGQRLAARTTSQALDINPLSARKLAAKAGTSPEEAVLELGNKANELIPNLIEPLDSANSKFAKILNAHDDAGASIGKYVRDTAKATAGAPLPEAGEAIQALKMAAKDYDQVDGGDLALQKTAQRLESLQEEGKLDFDRLSKMKSNIGKGFNKTEVPAGTEEIYGILNDKLQGVVDRLSVQDPAMAPELGRLKQIYTVTSRLLPAMSRTAAREVAGANVGGGVFSKMIPSALGGAIGGVPGAVFGAGAKYLQEAIAPDLGKNLAYMAMKSTPELIAAVQKVIPGITAAQAARIAGQISQGEKKPGMFKGGRVPDDVKAYVGTHGC